MFFEGPFWPDSVAVSCWDCWDKDLLLSTQYFSRCRQYSSCSGRYQTAEKDTYPDIYCEDMIYDFMIDLVDTRNYVLDRVACNMIEELSMFHD